MICKCCKANVPANAKICPDCGKPIYTKAQVDNSACVCEICGGRGRVIESHLKSSCLCFDCYHKQNDKRFSHAEHNVLSPREVLKQRALRKFYFKPLFYNEKPDLEMYQIACDIGANVNPQLWQKLHGALSGKLA